MQTREPRAAINTEVGSIELGLLRNSQATPIMGRSWNLPPRTTSDISSIPLTCKRSEQALRHCSTFQEGPGKLPDTEG